MPPWHKQHFLLDDSDFVIN